MKRWSEEEIKGHLTRLECNRVTILTMDSLAIIQQLQADLAEAKAESDAFEKLADDYKRHCAIVRDGLTDTIKKADQVNKELRQDLAECREENKQQREILDSIRKKYQLEE